LVTTAIAPSAHRARSTALWAVAAIAGIVAVFALVVVWSVRSGAIHRAYSDDWGYLRIAERFVHDGHLEGVGWNDTALVGQLLASKLISPVTGGTVAGLRVLSILCAAGSLVLVGFLARKSRASGLWAVAPLTLVVMIGFGSTVATYMTEQAALVGQLGSLAIGLVVWNRWQRSGRLPVGWLAALVVTGIWASSIRQAAVVAPVAVLAALLTHPRAQRRDRRVLVAVALAIAASVLLLQMFTPLSGPTMAIVRGSLTGQIARIYQAAATVALFIAPVTLLTGWLGRTFRIVARSWTTARGRAMLIGLGVLVVAGAALLHHRDGSLLVGNSLQQAGGYQGTDISFPHLFDPVSWTFVEVLSAVALFLFLVVLVEGIRSARRQGRGLVERVRSASALSRIAVAWTALSVLSALAVNFAYRAIYDRYLIPIVIGLALLALDNRIKVAQSHQRMTVTAVMFVPLLVLGVLSATDSQDILDLRWAGRDRLVAMGYDARTIDAGFDWMGYHYPGTARPDGIVEQPASYPPATYDVFFPSFVRCAFVSGDAVAPAGYTLVGRISGDRLFGLRSTTAYLYGISNGGTSCPAIRS